MTDQTKTIPANARPAYVRAVLEAAGCATYVITTRQGTAQIVCRCCGVSSPNAGDIANRWCAYCGLPHSEWKTERGEDPAP